MRTQMSVNRTVSEEPPGHWPPLYSRCDSRDPERSNESSRPHRHGASGSTRVRAQLPESPGWCSSALFLLTPEKCHLSMRPAGVGEGQRTRSLFGSLSCFTTEPRSFVIPLATYLQLLFLLSMQPVVCW